MFRYVVKRLFLFIPTLFLVSCLTFILSKQVPADQVAILLQIQGIDDSDNNWEQEYKALSEKMNQNLPAFYFSIQPNYYFSPQDGEYSIYEQRFIEKLSAKKYSKPYIKELLQLTRKIPENTREKLLATTSLSLLQSKAIALQNEIEPSITEALMNTIAQKEASKIKWHYPKIRYQGVNNQYHRWITSILKGDFGVSLLDTRPVTDKLWDAMKWSILLVGLNIFFSILLAFPIGVYNGMNPKSRFDTISNGILFAFYATPKFWLATLFIIFFTSAEYGAWTNIFPSVGLWDSVKNESILSILAQSWHLLILPTLILVIPDAAYLARLIRSSIQEESNKEYIKTAKSKGMSLFNITKKHILPNSLIPTISLIVGVLPGAIASTLVIEVIFNIPGIGRLMYVSIENADWAMIYPIVLIISVLAVVIFLLGDLLMAYLNPKIKLG